MLHYMLQTIAFQLFFLIIYDVFLKKETFFNWNRFYLLITSITSVTLPFIKLESIKTMVPKNFVIRLPEVIIGNATPVKNLPTEIPAEAMASSSFIWSWDYILYGGMIFAALILIFKIIKISLLIQNNTKRFKGNLIIVHLLKSNVAFSCFHYVFLGEYIREEEKDAIIEHETVHVNQKHTLDLMLFEVLRIVFWFNPLIYMYQNRMTVLHEYIADGKAIKNANKKQYYQNLLSQVFDTQQISFTNTFYKPSLIKKRIVMLNKSKSHRIHLLKYALLIPMVFGMLMYTSTHAQVKSTGKTNQEFTFDELKEKYYKEIVELYAQNSDIRVVQQKYDIVNMPVVKEKYIKSMDEVAKMYAYNQWSGEEFLRERKEEGTYEDRDLEYVNKTIDKYKSYDAYKAYKKTNEAKLYWESDIKDGELRLVVDDMSNLTEKEKKKKEQMLALINRDEYFHALIITDGNTTGKLNFEKAKKITDTDDFEKYASEVPFSAIDEAPTFKECKQFATQEDIRTCTSNTISDFVNKNFNTNLAKELGLPGRQHINVIFKIDTKGNITSVKSRAPDPKLEEEAIRVIKSLPQMTPGIHQGKAVIVPYSLPILFQVSE